MGAGRGVRAVLALIILGAASVPAQAGVVLDRVKATGTLRCAAVARPGLFDPQEDGAATGLFVELCRAVGTAVAGPAVRVQTDELDAGPSFEAVRTGREDLVFLTGGEIVDHGLAGALLPGAPVFFAQSLLMVGAGSSAMHPTDLADKPICFLQGDPSERHLEAWVAAHRLAIVRMPYQEPDEMNDAFDAGRCEAVAGEATALAALRREGGARRSHGRILPDPLATTPLLAATGTQDAVWSARVAWVLASLEAADRQPGPSAPGGTANLPIGDLDGLQPGWQAALRANSGSYAALLARTVGGSGLNLPAGPNASVAAGGLLAPPTAD